MARQYYQFLYSSDPMLTLVEGSCSIGASGVVKPSSACLGTGINGITKTGTGLYQIQFTDSFNRYIDFNVTMVSPTSAAGLVSDGSLVVGTPYQIAFASTSTNWVTLGVPASVVPAYGVPFVATSGASIGAVVGTPGTVVPITNSGIDHVEVLPNPNTVLYSIPGTTAGGFLNFQTFNAAGALASPTSGTVMRFHVLLRKSSLLGSNETLSNY